MPKETKPKKYNEALRYADLGWRMLAIVLAGVFGGRWLDGRFPDVKPLFTVSLAMLALAVSMYILIRAGSRKKKQ